MATPGYIESLAGGLDRDLRVALRRIFDYVLRNLRIGPVVHQTRAENWQAYFLTATTPATANQEFSIAHGLATTPHTLIPVLGLDAVNQSLVPLTVSRAADANRVYFISASTSVVFWVYVE